MPVELSLDGTAEILSLEGFADDSCGCVCFLMCDFKSVNNLLDAVSIDGNDIETE